MLHVILLGSQFLIFFEPRQRDLAVGPGDGCGLPDGQRLLERRDFRAERAEDGRVREGELRVGVPEQREAPVAGLPEACSRAPTPFRCSVASRAKKGSRQTCYFRQLALGCIKTDLTNQNVHFEISSH